MKFVKICIGRGRNKFENLCPIPLKKDSIKYVQTKPNQTGNEENLPRAVRVEQLALRDEDEGIRGKLFGNVHILI